MNTTKEYIFRKEFVDTVGIKSADLKDKFFALEFCGFPNCVNVYKAAIWCLEWLGKLNCQNTDLYGSLLFLSTSWRSLDRSPKSSFCFAEVIKPVRFKPN